MTVPEFMRKHAVETDALEEQKAEGKRKLIRWPGVLHITLASYTESIWCQSLGTPISKEYVMKRLSAVLLLTAALALGGGSAAVAKDKAPAPKTGVVTHGILIDDWPH